ncbi:MAG: GNAT family N-acetyltransferase [Candidatus Diapherotrites archaeon]|nr:GNAT family N-acetyltransferase [Candidatus Diapherotrites archaeon]MBT4597347.1 GNAT family N-acetyltransferase [Candidatus Diapherotrites archaeon]
MEEIIYREATVADLDQLKVLGKGLLDLYSTENRPHYIFKEDSPEVMAKYFKMNIESEDGFVFVAEKESHIVAYINLNIQAPENPLLVWKKEAYLRELFVSEDVRSLGIGKVLVEKAKEYSKAHGAEWINVLIDVQEPKAIDFYKKIGFKNVETNAVMKL